MMEFIEKIVIPLLSALAGALIAIWHQNKLDKRKDKKLILQTILAYRGIGAREPDFIKALNMVDVIFYDNKKVINILHEYFKHLYHPLFETGIHGNLLLDLILEMCRDIGYKNLKATDIMDYYFPEILNKLYPIDNGISVPSSNSPS